MNEMNFLFIMDPYETLNLETETSLLLMEELLNRGVNVFWSELPGLVLHQNKLTVRGAQVEAPSPLRLDTEQHMPIEKFDAIVVRPDPPVDETYLHLTYLLDFVPSEVVQFNRPEALRALNEKLLPLKWPHLTPDTIMTMHAEELENFLNEKKDIVVKPLGDCSGRGVVRLKSNLSNISNIIHDLFKDDFGRSRYVTAQEFLPDIKNGDKRVFLAGGKVAGIVNRIPAKGEFLGNIHQGAQIEASTLNSEEQSTIDEILPFLSENGILLAGADLIGGKLTELNITSPSAVRQINQVLDRDIHPFLVDTMIEEVNSKNQRPMYQTH